jgi:hypothetical protein
MQLFPAGPSQEFSANTLCYKCCHEHVGVEDGFREIAL